MPPQARRCECQHSIRTGARPGEHATASSPPGRRPGGRDDDARPRPLPPPVQLPPRLDRVVGVPRLQSQKALGAPPLASLHRVAYEAREVPHPPVPVEAVAPRHVGVHVGDLPHRGRVEVELEGILVPRLPGEPRVELLVGHAAAVVVRRSLHLAPQEARAGVLAFHQRFERRAGPDECRAGRVPRSLVDVVPGLVRVVFHGYFQERLLGVGVGAVFRDIQGPERTGGEGLRAARSGGELPASERLRGMRGQSSGEKITPDPRRRRRRRRRGIVAAVVRGGGGREDGQRRRLCGPRAAPPAVVPQAENGGRIEWWPSPRISSGDDVRHRGPNGEESHEHHEHVIYHTGMRGVQLCCPQLFSILSTIPTVEHPIECCKKKEGRYRI